MGLSFFIFQMKMHSIYRTLFTEEMEVKFYTGMFK